MDNSQSKQLKDGGFIDEKDLRREKFEKNQRSHELNKHSSRQKKALTCAFDMARGGTSKRTLNNLSHDGDEVAPQPDRGFSKKF